MFARLVSMIQITIPFRLLLKDRKTNIPAWSPVDDRIVYTHWVDPQGAGSTGAMRTLWIMQSDGAGKKMLYDNKRHYTDYPSWSPDGEKICVIGFGGMEFIDAATGDLIEKRKLSTTVINGKEQRIGPLRWHQKGFISMAKEVAIQHSDFSTPQIFLRGSSKKTQKKNHLAEETRW